MPFAPKIRKYILSALDEFIIPALRNRHVVQVVVEPPFNFSGIRYNIIQREWLEDKDFLPLQSKIVWKKENVLRTRMATFSFVYKGTCHELIGITRKMSSQLSETEKREFGGINGLTISAPTILSFPPISLRSSGVLLPPPDVGTGYAFFCKIMDNDVRISLNKRAPGKIAAMHNLQINDPGLAHLGRLYIEEMQARARESAQALQLAFMLRLQRYLLNYRPAVSNTCWVVPPAISDEAKKVLSKANLQLCYDVSEYIVNHLHSRLTQAGLANYFGVSKVHLNTVFKQARGTTVMRFTTRMRIEAAKAILVDKPERISDVAQLIGFASAASFGNVFRKHTGMSPREFQKQNARFSPKYKVFDFD